MKQDLYIIRHGETEGTQSDLMYGATELPLTREGELIVIELREQGIYPEIEGGRLYVSGMKRTIRTAELIYGDTPFTVEPRLREICLGKYEMKTFGEIMMEEYGRDWLEGRIESPEFEYGETLAGFIDRVGSGIDYIIRENAERGCSKMVLVVHGAVIAYIMEKFFPGTHASEWDWTPRPAYGYHIVLKDGKGVSYKTVGDDGDYHVIPSERDE